MLIKFPQDQSSKVGGMTRSSSSSINSKQDTVTIELVGALRHHAGRGKLLVTVMDRVSVLSLIRELEEKHGIPKGLLLEDGREGIRRNLLVLVNGREISVLEGVATRLIAGDRLTLLPVSHGG